MNSWTCASYLYAIYSSIDAVYSPEQPNQMQELQGGVPQKRPNSGLSGGQKGLLLTII